MKPPGTAGAPPPRRPWPTRGSPAKTAQLSQAMCIYIYIYTYVCVYIYIYIYTYICIHASIHASMHASISISISISTSLFLHYIYIYICMYIYIYIYIYIYGRVPLYRGRPHAMACSALSERTKRDDRQGDTLGMEQLWRAMTPWM